MSVAALLLLLALPAAAVAGEEALSVKADPARPGRVVVGSTRETKGEPVEVVLVGEKRRSSLYRSRDPGGFEVCDFLRFEGLSHTPGPIDVTVWRGERSSPLRLEYDGRSCGAEASTPSSGKPPRGISPLVLPTIAPPPPPNPPEAVVGDSLASARLERVVMSSEGKSHRFVVRFDRDVRLPAGAWVLMKKLIRVDSQEAIPGVASRQPLRLLDRGFEWKTQPGLLRFDPPLRNGEQLRLSFEIEGRLFDRQSVTFANPS